MNVVVVQGKKFPWVSKNMPNSDPWTLVDNRYRGSEKAYAFGFVFMIVAIAASTAVLYKKMEKTESFD